MGSPKSPLVRLGLTIMADSLLWIPAVICAILLRHDFAIERLDLSRALGVALLAGSSHAVSGTLVGLYRRRWLLGTMEEAVALALVCTGVGTVAAIADVTLLASAVPRSVPILAIPLVVVAGLGWRFVWRWSAERHTGHQTEEAHRAIVFGAGAGGSQVISAMRRDAQRNFIPVALLDDNPRQRNLRIMGVPVRGNRDGLGRVAEATGADTLVIAVPSAGPTLMRDLAEKAGAHGLRVVALPPVTSLLGPVGVSDLRPLTDADLLGRGEVTVDLRAVAQLLLHKRVLVTGAGGSIGSELCRQVVAFGPAALLMLDHDDSALHRVQLSLEGIGPKDATSVVLADVRDPDAIHRVFERFRPQIVLHAAALKHLNLLEAQPLEGFRTNVLGTWNLLQASRDHEIEVFVNISTDKAAQPSSHLGLTKRLAEQLTASFTDEPGTYLSVRFGNVVGSRGSVIPTFREQIARGGPVTVTHPEVTRFFMTVEEACTLVLTAAAIGHPGDTLVLDMGQPVRIADVARRLIAESDGDIEIVYTGLRPGEKLHEDLFDPADTPPTQGSHPLISHVRVPRCSLAWAVAMMEAGAASTAPLPESSGDIHGGTAA